MSASYTNDDYSNGNGYGQQDNNGAWTEHTDENGSVYWYNSQTGEQTYDNPNNVDNSSSAQYHNDSYNGGNFIE